MLHSTNPIGDVELLLVIAKVTKCLILRKGRMEASKHRIDRKHRRKSFVSRISDWGASILPNRGGAKRITPGRHPSNGHQATGQGNCCSASNKIACAGRPRTTRGLDHHPIGRVHFALSESGPYSASACSNTAAVRTTRFCGKYALSTYCPSMRCVLKNEPLRAIVERITSCHDFGCW